MSHSLKQRNILQQKYLYMLTLHSDFINKKTKLFGPSKNILWRRQQLFESQLHIEEKNETEGECPFPKVSPLTSSYPITSRSRDDSPDPHRTRWFPSLLLKTCHNKEIASSQEYSFIYSEIVPTSPESLSSQQQIVPKVLRIPDGNIVYAGFLSESFLWISMQHSCLMWSCSVPTFVLTR